MSRAKDVFESDPLNEMGVRFLGVGGEKIVFESSGSEMKIIKLSVSDVLNKLVSVLEEGDYNRNRKERMIIIKKHKELEKVLAQEFGVEHVLRTGVFNAKIPFNKKILLQLISVDEDIADELSGVEEMDPEWNFEIETVMQTQIKAKELIDPEKYQTDDFRIRIMSEDEFESSPDIKLILEKIRQYVNKNFLESFENDHPNEKYRLVIKEILLKMIKYTKKTGLMIDVFGSKNVTIFTDEKGEEGYHMLDVIMPGNPDAWLVNIKDDHNFGYLKHHYTYLYAVNELAKKIGLDEVLDPNDMSYFRGNADMIG